MADGVPTPVNELLNPGGAALLGLGLERTIGLELKLGWELALGWYLTLGPELLGITLGWEHTLVLELTGAYPEAARSTCKIRRSKDPTIQYSSTT
jgi:hypothetical protein